MRVFRGLNWLYHQMADYYYDFRYGINTCGIKELWQLDIPFESIAHGRRYQGTRYLILHKIFKKLHKDFSYVFDGVFLDIGAGKGRALYMAHYYGFKESVGVEFARDLCIIAKENLKRQQAQVIFDDIQNIELNKDIKLIFLFNPLDSEALKPIVEKIKADCCKEVLVVFVNPIRDFIFNLLGFYEEGFINHINSNYRVGFYKQGQK